MGKKSLLLFIGLVLPILVFLFLKMFGKNQFDVPYPELLKSDDCRLTYSDPYVVPDSVIDDLTNRSFELLLVNFGVSSKKLERIVSKYAVSGVSVDQGSDSSLSQNLAFMKRCIFRLSEPNTLVLLDSRRHIRGIYDGTDRDELDRLEAEIIILLKKY
jgi:hypothetical protein